MASFVRESKFRHCVVALDKREKHYEQLKVSTHQTDGSSLCASSAFLAYTEAGGSGSTVAVLPLSSTGKNHIPILAPSYHQPLIRAHAQPVQDFTFCPFRKNVLFTCAGDGAVKVWNIPEEGFVVDETSPSLSSLSMSSSSSAALRALCPHNILPHLVAARSSREIFLFDLTSAAQVSNASWGALSADLQSMAWSFNGDILAVTSKDKKLRLSDPRSGFAVTHETAAHTGNRMSRVIWLGDSPYLASFGHSSSQEREVLLFDSRNMSSPLKRDRIDSSLGAPMPFFDPDTNLLMLAGKGDTSVRLYEFDVHADSSTGVLHSVSNTPCGEVIKGAALLPKQANELLSCEVLRLLKLSESSVQPISVTVPRKEKFKYHEDLFPPTLWEAAPLEDFSVGDWLGGQNAALSRIPISPPLLDHLGGHHSQSDSCPSEEALGTFSESAMASPASTIATSSLASSPRSRPVSFGSQLRYRNMYGTENPKNLTYFNLRPNTTLSDSPLLASSELYWAVPFQGSGGGPVYVSRLSAFGKVEPDCPVINGHKSPVTDLAFSPFHNGLLATGSNDCTVKLWQLPEDASDTTTPLGFLGDDGAVARLTTHAHCIRTVNFHPTVNGLLITSSQDMTVRLFDVNSSQEVSRINIAMFGDQALPANISFNLDGSLASVACKDRVTRILDLRTGEVAFSTPDAGSTVLGRNLRTEWCTNANSSHGSLFCVSSAPSGLRTIHLWDPRNMRDPTCTRVVDSAAGQLFPMYDESAGVTFVAGKGDTIVRFYEMTSLIDNNSGEETKCGCEKGLDFQTGTRDAIAGVCLLPKRTCNVANVEVARMLKLTVDAVIPLSFTLPRAEALKSYFQDDIFQPVRSKEAHATVFDWISRQSPDDDRSIFQPVFESLKPENMKNISEKPVERAQKTQSSRFRDAINKEEEEAKQREATFNRLQEMAIQRSVYHPNPSGGGHGFKVDAKPVEDSDSDNNWDD